MSKELVNFYASVLETAGLTIVDGVVHQHLPDEGDVPVTVSKKTLVLPTDHWLGETDIHAIQFFHPIAENVIRKESVVFKFLRRLIVISTTSAILETMSSLLHVLCNKDTHSTLDAITQLPLLRCAPDADKDLFDKFEKIIDKIDPTGDNAFMNVVILRGKRLKDKDYTRIAKVTFPLLKALEETENNQVFGVKLRKKDIAALTKLIHYVLPELSNDDEFYSTGSRSGVAPSFHALLGTYAKFIQALNSIKRAFGQDEIALNWLDELNDFGSFKGLIPKLPGNDGEPLEGEEERVTTSRQTEVEERPASFNRLEEAKRLIAAAEEELEKEKKEEEQSSSIPVPASGGVSMGSMNLDSGRRAPNYRWMNDEDRIADRGGYYRDERDSRYQYGGANVRRPYGSSFNNRSNGYQNGYGGHYSQRSRSSGRGGLF